MRTDIDHLPAAKQRELDRVVQILFEEFADANGTATGKRKLGRIQKIILYGSHATGRWVDEPHKGKGYQSDFDILVIVNQKELTDRVAYWERADERLNRERSIIQTLRTPVNFIVHTLQEVNDGLAHGRSFFIDVRRDGIALYQEDDSELHKPRPKTPKQALESATEYFRVWMDRAASSQKQYLFCLSQAEWNDAAFNLHQATERLYHGLLLVLTAYTPHVHNLGFLRTQAERIVPELIQAWPRQTKHERAYFSKLKDAYVKARYSDHYRISQEELQWLADHINQLGIAVHEVCERWITQLERTVQQH